MVSLLEFIMSMTYSQFDGEYYQQVHRAPMVNLVSVVGLDMYIEDLEDEAMDTATQDTRPSMWRHYIDDLFQVAK